MSSREFFVETIKDEQPRFERALRAVPEDKLEYRPHAGCRSARELVAVFADEAQMFRAILERGELALDSTSSRYAGLTDALTAFGKGFADAARIAAALSDVEWASPARMTAGGKVEWETTRCRMAWGLLLDLIHHRGQLSVYLRPMGGKVPPIYGPSGDASA
ncbi:MAG TPA: DinB family protein [Vicinamibacteria bacterium]|nr:DinB family protein [Vicinamibacteria bacterium]